MGRAAKLLHFMWSSIRNRVTQIRFIVFTESFKKYLLAVYLAQSQGMSASALCASPSGHLGLGTI